MSQVSERLSRHGLGLSAQRVSPLRTAAARLPSTAVHWRRQYRRRLLFTDTVFIIAAVSLPGVVSTIGMDRLGGLGAYIGNVIGVSAGTTAGAPSPAVPAVAIAVGWVVCLQLFQSRAAGRIAIGAFEYKAVADASCAMAGVIAVIAVVAVNAGLRSFLILTIPVGMALLLLGRWGWRRWLQSQRALGRALSDVVVYGQAKDTPYVVRQLAKKTGAAYRVVGVVVDGKPDRDAENLIHAVNQTLPLAHGGASIEDEVSRLGADAVVVAGELEGGRRAIQDLGWRLEKSRTEVILVSSLTNVAGPRISMRPVEGLPLMHVELPTFTGLRHVIKRAMDIALSLVALLVLAPVFLGVGLLVRSDSQGGAFFRQVRTGRHGELFTMYKFRSMVANAEEKLDDLEALNEGAGPLFKLRADPRVTRVGRWLRKYSLDELPQFFNVLKGDMSIVGPRPPLPGEVAAYRGHTHRRLYIKPGVTGLWQVNGRSDLDWEESVRLDLYYVENWSVTGDLMIMWRTFKVMIAPSGAY